MYINHYTTYVRSYNYRMNITEYTDITFLHSVIDVTNIAITLLSLCNTHCMIMYQLKWH